MKKLIRCGLGNLLVPPGQEHLPRVGRRTFFSGCAIVAVFWLWREMDFGFTSILRVQYMMGHRNRYFKGMEDGQMAPRVYPNFNSYVKNLCILVFQTDGQTDGR
jgi:hypothetical protein